MAEVLTQVTKSSMFLRITREIIITEVRITLADVKSTIPKQMNLPGDKECGIFHHIDPYSYMSLFYKLCSVLYGLSHFTSHHHKR